MAIIADVIQRPDSTYPVIVKPYKLDISQFGEKVRDRMKFTITNVSDKEVILAMVADMPKFAEISLPKRIGAGQTASGEVTLRPDALEKPFEKSFTFDVLSDQDTKARFTVPVKRSVKGAKAETAAATTSAGGH